MSHEEWNHQEQDRCASVAEQSVPPNRYDGNGHAPEDNNGGLDPQLYKQAEEYGESSHSNHNRCSTGSRSEPGTNHGYGCE